MPLLRRAPAYRIPTRRGRRPSRCPMAPRPQGPAKPAPPLRAERPAWTSRKLPPRPANQAPRSIGRNEEGASANRPSGHPPQTVRAVWWRVDVTARYESLPHRQPGTEPRPCTLGLSVFAPHEIVVGGRPTTGRTSTLHGRIDGRPGITKGRYRQESQQQQLAKSTPFTSASASAYPSSTGRGTHFTSPRTEGFRDGD